MNPVFKHSWCLVALGSASLLLPFRTLQVDGASMEPTLHHGDRYLIDRAYYRLSGLCVGDIVVVHHDGSQLVKRIAALPGQRLRIDRDFGGRKTGVINLTLHPGALPGRNPDVDELIVPPGTIYLVGDNARMSDDSRSFGPIPATEVVGVVRSFTLSRSFPVPPPIPDHRPADASVPD